MSNRRLRPIVEPESETRAGGYSTDRKLPKMKAAPKGPAPGTKPKPSSDEKSKR